MSIPTQVIGPGGFVADTNTATEVAGIRRGDDGNSVVVTIAAANPVNIDRRARGHATHAAQSILAAPQDTADGERYFVTPDNERIDGRKVVNDPALMKRAKKEKWVYHAEYCFAEAPR